MASKLNPRASRLDLRPDLRVMMYPIKLDQREIAALAEINRQYRDGDVQVYVGTDRDTLARIAGAKTLDTGVEFLLGLDRVSGRYLAAPVEWVEQVARMTAVAIDQGLIPEPPEDPEPPPMPRSKGRTPGRSAFPGGKMRNPRYQPLDKARFIADLNSLWKGKDLPEAPRDYSLYPENLNRPGQTPSHITMTWLAARALQQQFPNIHYHQAKSTNSVYVNGYPFGQNEIRISGHSKYGRLGPLDVHNWSSKPTLADRLAVAVQAAQLGAKTFPELAKLLKEPGQAPNPPAHSISPYSDPRLHDRIKDRILASDKGGRPGQWSARKAQLVAQAYEAAGGGYTGRKTSAQASLSRWTKEDWGTRSGKPSIQGPAATGERYLPRAVRESMPDKVYAASTRAKRASIAAGRQFSPQPGPARAYTTLRLTRIA